MMHNALKVYSEVEVKLHTYLSSEIDWDSRFVRFNAEEGAHSIHRVNPTAGPDMFARRSCLEQNSGCPTRSRVH
jgi:hypothetical protein